MNEDNFKKMHFISLIHHISKNSIKFAKSNVSNPNMIIHGRYLLVLNANENLTQEEIANMYGISKGNIAKSFKKLEDEGYIIREIDNLNRRKHIINITHKGKEFISEIKKLNTEWEKKIGIDSFNEEFLDTIREIARKSSQGEI